MAEPKIVFDAAIPHAAAALDRLGRAIAMPGAAIDRAAIADTDVLVTRSITRVDRALVEGTRVRLIATATAGIDHVDTAALTALGIAFASAAGCNAQAVAEVVLGVLAEAGRPTSEGVGIVGFGHVGRRTASLLRAHGHAVLCCDPPLAERRKRMQGDTIVDADPILDAMARHEPLLSLRTLLRHCPVVSLHVPLTHRVPHSTRALLGPKAFAAMVPGALLIHTCRGGVVDEHALLAWLDAGRGQAALDVYEGEPTLRNPQLLRHSGVVLATPHIAGYSHEGKLRATQLATAAVAAHVGARHSPRWPSVPTPTLRLPDAHGDPGPRRVRDLLRRALALADDARDLAAVGELAAGHRGPAFERLRARYRMRSEFASIAVTVADARDPAVCSLQRLGFDVQAP